FGTHESPVTFLSAARGEGRGSCPLRLYFFFFGGILCGVGQEQAAVCLCERPRPAHPAFVIIGVRIFFKRARGKPVFISLLNGKNVGLLHLHHVHPGRRVIADVDGGGRLRGQSRGQKQKAKRHKNKPSHAQNFLK